MPVWCVAWINRLNYSKIYLKMNLLKKLKSNEFALTVAILSVIVQSFHSYSVFYSVSSLRGTGWGMAQAALFAIVFDLAILFYTVRNRKDVVLGASVLMFIMNGYYYWVGDLALLQLIFGLFLAIVIPMTQYYYAEEIVEDVVDPTAVDDKLRREYNEAIEATIKMRREHDQLVDETYRLKTVVSSHVKDLNAINELRKKDADDKYRLQGANTRLSEELGKSTAENFQLKKRLGEIPADAEINPIEEADRTLLGVQKPGKIQATAQF